MKKVIMKVFFHDEKAKRKGMKSVSGLQGVESISMDTKDQKLTVIGNIDPVDVVSKLRKLCSTEILSVGPAKEEKKKEEPKKEEPKKDDKKKDVIAELQKAYEAYYKADELLKASHAYFTAHGYYPDDELLKAYQAYFTAHGYYPAAQQNYFVRSVEEEPNACVIC